MSGRSVNLTIVQPVLSKHLRDNEICLLKTGPCLIQVRFSVVTCFGNACLIEVASKTGFTVHFSWAGLDLLND